MTCETCRDWGTMVPTGQERVQVAIRSHRKLGLEPVPIYVSNLQTYMGCRNHNCKQHRKPKRAGDSCLSWTKRVSR